MRIVQAAITSYARLGIEKTTYASLARTCGISRPLIHHYFPDLESLFLLVAKYVRSTLLKMASEGIQAGGTDPCKMMLGYVHGCFEWVRLYPDQGKFWMLYFYECGRGKTARETNTELVERGHARIRALIESGAQICGWRFQDSEKAAKVVQLILTGAITSAITEGGYLARQDLTELTMGAIETYLGVPFASPK